MTNLYMLETLARLKREDDERDVQRAQLIRAAKAVGMRSAHKTPHLGPNLGVDPTMLTFIYTHFVGRSG